MSALRFGILGPLRVEGPHGAIPITPGKQQAILAVLLLKANEIVERDRLIDELWGEAAPPQAIKALQVHVAALRRALGDGRDVLVTQPPGYRLAVPADAVDLHRFESLLDEARHALDSGDPAYAHRQATAALELWRGRPFAGVEIEGILQSELARLEELQVAAQELAVEAALRLGRHRDLVGELDALVAEHPLREGLRAQQMVALYRCGRQADALEAFQAARRALVEELGIEPSRRLRELQQAILDQNPRLEAPVAPEADAPAVPGAVFVGRDRELDELTAGLDDAVAGRGGAFLLVGEPGIGKSRLVEELLTRARARGARVLVGRCWEAGGAPVYWPWVQLLRAYVREADQRVLAEQLGASGPYLAQILPELRDRLPGLASAVGEGEAARLQLFDAAVEFLRNAARAQPLVLALDDLHAADVPSLLLLQYLAREVGSSRIFIVGACRDVDPVPGEALAQMLVEVAREPSTRRLDLRGLTRGEVERFLATSTEREAPDDLVATLHAETEGNPLFLGEIVRLLRTESPGSDGRSLSIPQTIRDVIARRLTHLSEPCRRVMVLASVVGREFTLDTLAHLSRLSHDELLDRLDEAAGHRIVVDAPGSPGTLRFAHVLIRDTLYEGLTTARRVHLHRQLVETLEERYGSERGPHLAELAHHSMAGGDFERGVRYAAAAADRALAMLAYEEAARLYAAALEAFELATATGAQARCDLLLAAGEAELLAGNSAASKARFAEAAAEARRLRLNERLARAAVGYGGRFVWARKGRDQQLVPLLEEGLTAIGQEDVELRARLLVRLAGVLRDEPARDRRDALSREAVELARRSGNPAALAYALDGRSVATFAPDTVEDCAAAADELVEVAARIGDTERLVNGHTHRSMSLEMLGRLPEAQAANAAALEAARRLRQPVHFWQSLASQANLDIAVGDRKAEATAQRAWEFGRRAQPEMALPVWRTQRFSIAELWGGLDDLEADMRALAAEFDTRPVFLAGLMLLLARAGADDEAREHLRALALDEFAALPFDQEWLLATSYCAEAAWLLRDAEAAATLRRLLAPWKHLNACDHPEAIRGSVARYLGLAAAATGDAAEAERCLTTAVKFNDAAGMRPWAARAREDLSSLLSERDPARAERVLAEAAAIISELGMRSSLSGEPRAAYGR